MKDYRILCLIVLVFSLLFSGALAKTPKNRKSAMITPLRFPLPPEGATVTYQDLDGDGDPDILRTVSFHALMLAKKGITINADY